MIDLNYLNIKFGRAKMRFVDVIEKKKNNEVLNKAEIQFWIDGLVNESIPDYQSSALLMAIVLNGMNSEETSHLTYAMMHSGVVYDLSTIAGVKVDKHSTGGVGDKTTLALGPMVAACGAKVAKMSGRGLGHTGGTLDKLEAITNFNIEVDENDFIKQVNEIGIAIIGQTASTVPADKKLYALRDVTATVASIPLIASSIMSKKLASGSDTILLDVKYGDGAFMSTPEQASTLAQAMIEIGKSFAKDVKVIISNMNQPLGFAIGNALEVKEAIDTLNGKGPKDFTELCLQCGAIMLQQAKIASSYQEGITMLESVIENKSALNKLAEMVKYQDGDIQQILDPASLPQATYKTVITAKSSGYIAKLEAESLGILAMELGAGRATKDDVIDYAVGLVIPFKVGDQIKKNQEMVVVHHNQPLTDQWITRLYDAIKISSQSIKPEQLVYAML